MLNRDDKQLYDYTMKMMENITTHYLKTDFDKGTDVNKLIEHGVARKIAAIMPNKYTEVEVTVAEVNRNLYVTATYSIDGEAEIVAIHKDDYKAPEQGLGLPAPTICAPITQKISVGGEKPTIDFSQISQLCQPSDKELPRYESGLHVGIDLATVDVEDQRINATAKEVSDKIDKQILEDIMDAAKAIDMSESIWAVPTFGWTEEKTTWDKPEEITWATSWGSSLGYIPPLHRPFSGVITTDNTAPVWYNPYSVNEKISFTEDELDELIELINTSESKVMEFV